MKLNLNNYKYRGTGESMRTIFFVSFTRFYTFAHLKRRPNDDKNEQKCKNLVSIRLETDMKFKNLLFYETHLGRFPVSNTELTIFSIF